MAHGWFFFRGFGVFYIPVKGVGGSSPQITGHPTSVYDTGVNMLSFFIE